LCGEVSATAPLRYSPAGVPIVAFTLRHTSEQMEAGMCRTIQCEVPVIVVGKPAESARDLHVGDRVGIKGFIAQKSRTSTGLVLHVNSIEMIERG
jgi:primosomal replication protein N